jgi:CDP-glucose 4,6-dehydratase
MNPTLGQRIRELNGPVLVTGHSGFKGTWLSLLLEELMIPVVGLSLPAEPDSLYDRASRIGAIPEIFGDIRDPNTVQEALEIFKPSVVLHLAAQPLVLKSYEMPVETFAINVMGTVNVLDAIMKCDSVKAVGVITTDKVYKNLERQRTFLEDDPLGGKDPYSASKVATETVVAAWQNLSQLKSGPQIIALRAGNVIGGGDYSLDRLLPDIIRSYQSRETLIIRNPESTRPWQHVLDPLAGYLLAIDASLTNSISPAFNFGPIEESLSVAEVVSIAKQKLTDQIQINILRGDGLPKIEAKTLAINPNKAMQELGWAPKFSQTESVESTINWWLSVLNGHETALSATERNIAEFLDMYSRENN